MKFTILMTCGQKLLAMSENDDDTIEEIAEIWIHGMTCTVETRIMRFMLGNSHQVFLNPLAIAGFIDGWEIVN